MGQARPPRRGPSVKGAGLATAWILIALALVSINLRPAITTIAGTMEPLQHALAGSLAWASAVWAVPAVLGGALIYRAGESVGRPDGTGGATGGSDGTGRAASGAGSPEMSPQTTTAGGSVSGARKVQLRKQRTAWAVTAFFGLQAMLYFAITSLLAVFLVSKGQAAADAATLLAWFSVAGLPASLLAPVGLQLLMVGLLEIFQSAGFGLGMALVVIRSAEPQSAGSRLL
ncbi:hypothetical protein [Arthrobacter sp. FW306-04-A]|uniref:hypothetical protein n=1 Tax=Arthrobacter sp. FW306-04-A TaxID=2879619 RepID=UPI0037C1A423|nr:hypothetical protein LFT43_03020 [Arthrobacter sp. FW306-04-A]